MNLIEGAFPYFALPLIISFICVPLCKKIGLKLGIYAQENKRTVHHGKIVRIGGVAIFVAFMISCAVFMQADTTLNAILIGATIVFFGGLIDDMFDIPPLLKLLFQIAGALVAITQGSLAVISVSLPFGIAFDLSIFGLMVSIIWVVGISNAINLIDGLDGLCAGISFIVTCVIGLLGFFMGRRDVCVLCLMLCGATLGFLPYNFHPASIFMGDCGALWLGFLLATFSLLGFKTASFITLVLPIIVLFIPISDTLVAIVRRKLRGQPAMQADREHLHHILMYRLHFGHRQTVLVLYFVTFLFGCCAILSYFHEILGLTVALILLVIYEIFIEYTGMINIKYHPVISIWNKLFGKFIHIATMPEKMHLKDEKALVESDSK